MVVRCHVWKPAPEVASAYLGLVNQFGADPAMQSWAEGYVRHHAGRCLWDATFLSGHYQFASCLNVGGAPFLFEHLLMRSRPDLKLVSLDLDATRFPSAAKILGLKIVEMNVEELAPGSVAAKYDCVVFCEVFEHLRMNILRTIASLRELLEDEGILYLTMPNGLGLHAWLRYLTRGRTGPPPLDEWGKLQAIGHMGHVREYSYTEVREVLEACGFTIDRFFFRRNYQHWGTLRSRLRNGVIDWVHQTVPSLGDEVGLVARKSRRL
jgi:SAM-dependent methyltransferase